MMLHGYPRMTKDVDLLLPASKKNIQPWSDLPFQASKN